MKTAALIRRYAPGCAALTVVLALAGCGGDKKTGTPVPQEQTPVRIVPFSPPADSGITARQAVSWKECNRVLDSLSLAYRELFVTDDPARRQTIQETFLSDQNTVCLRQGLPGGYREYLWITTVLAHPKNKTIRDTMGIMVY